MGTKNEARLTSSLLARKGSAQPFPAADVFSLPPQTVVTPASGVDERAEGRRPQPTGWSSSPVTPAQEASGKVEATQQASSPADNHKPESHKPEANETEAHEAKTPEAKTPQAETKAPESQEKASGSWTTQSIFSALKRTPGLHPAADGAAKASEEGVEETPRKVSGAAQYGMASGGESAASSAKDRVALTLRVDQERHRRLRVLAAQTKSSSQEILLAALDSYIDGASQGMSFCDCLKPTSMCCKSS